MSAGKDWRTVIGGGEGDHEENIAPLLTASRISPKEALSRQPDSGEEDTHSAQILDLSHHKPMADYAKEKHYERFGKRDLLSYSVKFYPEENIVRWVSLSRASQMS